MHLNLKNLEETAQLPNWSFNIPLYLLAVRIFLSESCLLMISPVCQDHRWGHLNTGVCCCFSCLICDTNMELINMMRPPVSRSICWRPLMLQRDPFHRFIHYVKIQKGKNQTSRLIIALAVEERGRLLPAPMQPYGYKAIAKMQVLGFFFPYLGLHYLQVSTEIGLSRKGVPDCSWVLQKLGLPYL